MQITLNVPDTEATRSITNDDRVKIQEIVSALIRTGSLIGVRSGFTGIHFDHEGNFTRIQLDYQPFVKRKNSV